MKLATSKVALMRRGVLLVVILAGMSAPITYADEPIKLAVSEGAAPLSFQEAGQIQGIEVDVAREVFAARLGLTLDISIYPWERAQQMVRSGAADGFISIATDERRTYANCGRIPVLRSSMRPLVRRDHPRRQEMEAARSLADLRRFNIVSYLGKGWAKHNLAGFEVTDAADFPSSIKGLAHGRGDLALVSAHTGFYYLRELGLEDELMMLPMALDVADYVLCLGKRSPHVAKLAEFERVLEVMRTDGGYQEILERYGAVLNSQY